MIDAGRKANRYSTIFIQSSLDEQSGADLRQAPRLATSEDI